MISYLFLAYNQKTYMCDSVLAVLEQDCSDLEIIFSDDCSQDGTYCEIEKIVANYSGPHKVILNKNDRNLGISLHYKKLIEMATGEFLVIGAGDDIPLPNRVTTLVNAWRETGVSCLFSNSIIINDKGDKLDLLFDTPPNFAGSLDDFKEGKVCWANGASLAFEKDIFMKYGDIGDSFQEDGAMAFRALLNNGLGYIHLPLIKYRHHIGGISSGLLAVNRLKFQLNEYSMKVGWYKDAVISHSHDVKLLNLLDRQIRKAQLKKMIFSIPYIGLIYNELIIVLKNFKVKR